MKRQFTTSVSKNSALPYNFSVGSYTEYMEENFKYLPNQSSSWILMSCQPHRVTSGQSNLGHKQIHISKLVSHIYISTVCQVSLQNQSLRKHKTYIRKHQTHFFEVLVPSILPLLKECMRLGHVGIVDHFV